MCLLHLIEWSVTYVAIPHYCIILGLSILNWTFYFSFPFRRPGLITNCLGTPRPCNDSSMLRCVRNCRRYYYSPSSAFVVWRHPTWLTRASLFRRSSAGGSCGRLIAGHSSCHVPGLRSVGETLLCRARPHGTAFPSNCGLHHCLLRRLQKKLKTHLFGC